MKSLALLSVLLAGGSLANAQANDALSTTQLRTLAAHCASRVHPDTIEAITRQESGLHPFALSINYPKTEAARQGHPQTFYELARQPHNKAEAINWTRWFVTHGHSVSIGLMQVNSIEAKRIGVADLRALFEPCVNLAAGAVILQESYRGKSHDLNGLSQAFAIYNAGNVALGTQNGYASGVVTKAPPLAITTR